MLNFLNFFLKFLDRTYGHLDFYYRLVQFVDLLRRRASHRSVCSAAGIKRQGSAQNAPKLEFGQNRPKSAQSTQGHVHVSILCKGRH